MAKNIAQLYSDSSYSVCRSNKYHAVGVSVFRKSARTGNKIGQAFGLCLQSVPTGESYFAPYRGCALQFPIWLPHDEHIVVGLHCNIRIRPRRGWHAWRPEVLPIRSALEQVARVERNAKRVRSETV